MNQSNGFEKLSLGMTSSERQEMLKKLTSISSKVGESESLVSGTPSESETGSPEEKLKMESLFLRIYLYIKALFSSSNIETEYNYYLVAHIAKDICSVRSDIINPKKGVLLEGVHSRISQLKNAALFFRPYVDDCSADEGAFYVFLASVICRDLVTRIEGEVNPYSIPLDSETIGDARGSLLRKMEVIFQEIPVAEKEKMYSAVQGFHWMRLFVKLPFDKFLSRFMSIDGAQLTCPLDTISDELDLFCTVLCNGKKIPLLMIESLFLFAMQKDISDDSPVDEYGAVTDIEDAAATFMVKAVEHISTMKMFITEIPLRKLSCIAFHSASWVPAVPQGIEDWFITFKLTFKKIFDQKWNRWLKDRKKAEIQKKISLFLDVKHMPLLPYRPWEMLWSGMEFHREMTLTFLNAFYKSLYSEISKTLKIIMIEADFYQRDNRVEFTDAYNEFNHQAQNIDLFNEKLTPKGQLGSGISKIVNESLRSVQNKARLDNLLLTMESESNVMIAQFCAACRLMISVLGGITGGSRNSKYDTLANISTIQGKYNEAFRSQMRLTKETIATAYEIIKELESAEIVL